MQLPVETVCVEVTVVGNPVLWKDCLPQMLQQEIHVNQTAL
jgi:hypothetical protein